MNEQEIIQMIKDLPGTIRGQDYAKVIGYLVQNGLTTKAERTHGEVKIQYLAEKFQAFHNQSGNAGNAEIMIKALKKGGIKIG